MKINYVKGNLLDTDCKFILHGCNARGVMGAGVAKAIRKKWPKAYTDYRKIHEKKGLVIGHAYPSEQPDGKVIFNAITQESYGTDRVQVNYDAISKVIGYIDNHFLLDHQKVAMPMIGAGLGGGKWESIKLLIELGSSNFQPVVYYL